MKRLTSIALVACVATFFAAAAFGSDANKNNHPAASSSLKGSPAIITDSTAAKQTATPNPPPQKASTSSKQASASVKQASAEPAIGEQANIANKSAAAGTQTGKQATPAAKSQSGKNAQATKAAAAHPGRTGLSAEEQAFLDGGSGAGPIPQNQQQQLNRGIRGANVSHFPWLARPRNSSGYLRVAPDAKFVKTKTGQYITASVPKSKAKAASPSHKSHCHSTKVARSRRFVPTLTYDQVPVPSRHPQ